MHRPYCLGFKQHFCVVTSKFELFCVYLTNVNTFFIQSKTMNWHLHAVISQYIQKASGFRVFLETLALWKPTAQLLEVRNVSGGNIGSQNGQHVFGLKPGEPERARRMLKRLVCLQHDNDLQTNSRLRWWCNRSCALMIRRMRRGTALHLFLKKTLSCDL